MTDSTIKRVILVTHNVANHAHPRLLSDFADAFKAEGLEVHLFLPELDGRGAEDFAKALMTYGGEQAQETLLVDINARVQMPEARTFRRFSMLIDHAYQHLQRIRTLPPKTVLGLIEEDSPSFLKMVGEQRPHCFCYHAAPETRLSEPLALPDRDIGILFAGRLETSPRLEDLKARLEEVPEPIPALVLDLVDRLTAKEEVTSATRAAFEAADLSPKELDDESLFQVLRVAADYVEALHRFELLTALSGHSVTVAGTVSERFFERVPEGFTFKGTCSMEDVLTLAQRSKLLLNVLGVNQTASHERLFYGASVGAVLGGEASHFVQQTFQASSAFLALDPARASEQVSSLLAHPERMQRMADRAWEVVCKGHTWRHRVKTVLAALADPSPEEG